MLQLHNGAGAYTELEHMIQLQTELEHMPQLQTKLEHTPPLGTSNFMNNSIG